MGNIIDYARENLKTFEEEPLSVIDSMIFTRMAYIRWPKEFADIRTWKGMRLPDLFCAEYFDEMMSRISSKQDMVDLFSAMIASPRYRDIVVKGYISHFDEEAEKQFSVVTFQISDDLCFIAFRGTDNSFVGWKEDFNMAFRYPVPSQIEAANYVCLASLKCPGTMILGGHSKGGNLAVYAGAINGFLFDRIEKIYSHDGPGFLPEVLETEAYQKIMQKVDKTVPEESIVGMLLNDGGNYTVVKSNESNIHQHNMFSWEIEDGKLAETELSKSSRSMGSAINEWVNSVDVEKREEFVDTMYLLFDQLEVDTVREMNEDWSASFASMRKTAEQLPPEKKELIFKIFYALAETALPIPKLSSIKKIPSKTVRKVSEWSVFRRNKKDEESDQTANEEQESYGSESMIDDTDEALDADFVPVEEKIKAEDARKAENAENKAMQAPLNTENKSGKHPLP